MFEDVKSLTYNIQSLFSTILGQSITVSTPKFKSPNRPLNYLLVACFHLMIFSSKEKFNVLQTIQMKLKLLCVWAEQAILGSAKTALSFKYEI